MGDNLKQTAVSGARWGFIENISSMGITFIVGIILARILSPEQYGLMGDLAIFIAISISLIDNGFSAAIIRKPEPTKEDLNTTFLTNFGISIICFIVLFACAPLVSDFFNEPQLTLLLRVLSFILIVNAVSIIQRALIVKNVDFKRLTVCTVTSSLFSGIVGIWMALTGCGVWSLVGQQVSKQVANSIMLWMLGTWKPNWKFSKKSFKELFSYGSNVMITGFAGYNF
jgi:O-antigen/teichoic acid export membrane protein